jgi:hypothetical protein
LWFKDDGKEIPLLLQDGAQCQKFYQIVDALTNNQETISKIFKAIEITIEETRKGNNVKFEQSVFSNGIRDLKLEELSTDDHRKMSIFGIAAAFKATMPPDEFIIDQGRILLETTLETIYEQIEKLCHENERGKKFVDLIISQLDLFESNFDLYREKHPSVIDDYLRTLYQVVIKVFSDKGFSDAADKVEKRIEHLFSSDNLNLSNHGKKEDENKDEAVIRNTQKPIKKEGM